MKTLAILSNKGGVGKTSIAVNVAVYLAKQGNNVCLLDHDFQGPSLMTFFNPRVEWINEFLSEDLELSKCLQEIDPEIYNISGKLIVGFSNPTHEAISNNISADKNKSMKMLQNLVKLRKELKKEPYNIDYFVIDCCRGGE